MLRGSKAELVKTFGTQLETAAGWRIDSYLRGGGGSSNEVEVPVELLFLEEFLALVRQLGSGGSAVVGDFARTFLNVGRISSLLERMDDWFPLKLELLRYFCSIYLGDLSVCGTEERAEVERTVVGTVLKQLAQGCVRSRHGGAMMLNSGVFNIFNRRTLHSDKELVMRVGVDTACLQYFVFGVNEVLRQYLEKLFPKWVAGGRGDKNQLPDKAS